MNRKNHRINAKTRRTRKAPSARSLNFQAIVLREARKFALLVLCCGLPAYLYVLSLTEKRALTELEGHYTTSQHELKLSGQANDRIVRELDSLKSNQDYLEIIARDHLNLALKGETIVRIER